MSLRIQFFGRFEVWRNGQLLGAEVWKRRKTQMLLKVLAAERGKHFTQDQLIEAIFPHLSPDKASKNVRSRLSELRHILEPDLGPKGPSRYILRGGLQSYSFSKEQACRIDLEEFQHFLGQAQAAEKNQRWGEATEAYQQAIHCYKDDFLAEDLYEEWTLSHRRHWRELYLTALARLAESLARLGHFAQAIQECHRVLSLFPECEQAYRQKMLYHYLAGEVSEALKTFQTCVGALKTQLDSAPSPQTQRLHQAILQGKVNEVENLYPLPAKPAKHNLPLQLTSFIGRAQEHQEIKIHLKETRLLTLTGPGGAGKTRLALQAAETLVTEYAQGVWFVELASLTDPTLIAQAVAAALGISEQPGRSLQESLVQHLRSKEMLLVLDNCEHLIEMSAQLTGALLSACPHLTVLATSRQTLGVPGEVTWYVPPLSMPDSTFELTSCTELTPFDAIQLFIERARLRQPRFAPTPQNASLIVQLCQKLEGIPLAIELAAARLAALPLEEIVHRLDDRFRLLISGNRTLPRRQQTLEAAIDWSYELLSEKERLLLQRLAVFMGGFTLPAIEAVGSDERLLRSEIFDLLTQLIEKSLVALEEHHTPARYRMLETVRHYGHQKLLESKHLGAVHRRYLDFFIEFAEKCYKEYERTSQDRWRRDLLAELGNLRVALQCSWQIDTNQTLRLAIAMGYVWDSMCYWTEGIAVLKRALESAPEASSAVRVRAFNWIAYLIHRQGEFSEAKVWGEAALALARATHDAEALMEALNILGEIAWNQGDREAIRTTCHELLQLARRQDHIPKILLGLNNLGSYSLEAKDYPTARHCYEEMIELSRRTKNKSQIAYGQHGLGRVAREEGQYELARHWHCQSLTIFQDLQDITGLSASLFSLGHLALTQKEYATARSYYEQSLALRRQHNLILGMARDLRYVGFAARMQGDHDAAFHSYRESLLLQQEAGNKAGIALSLGALAMVACDQNQLERAAHLFAAAELLRKSIGLVLDQQIDHPQYDQYIKLLRATLGENIFVQAWDRGCALSLEAAVEFAQRQSDRELVLSPLIN